jgi:hypothetical protein
MPSFWLPPNAQGNGLPAERWAEIIVVSRDHATELLDAFRSAGVPACAAPVEQRWSRQAAWRVWVDADHYGAAENAMLREMTSRAEHGSV